jgi:diacylglycerol kinase family enzyme
MTRYLLVANPTARSGGAAERIRQILDRVLARGIEADFFPTKAKGQTIPELARLLQDMRYDACIYMGGDGTFREVAAGIMASQTQTPMGMMPSGTANDQGLSFGVSNADSALERNLDIISAGHTLALDAGRARRFDDAGKQTGEILFFDSIGWGLQSDILVVRNQDKEAVEDIPVIRRLYRDKAVYVGAAVDRFLATYIEPAKFTADVEAWVGQEHIQQHWPGLADVVIKNTAIYGGSWVLHRWSEPNDGLFEFVPIQGRREWLSKAVRDLAALPIWQEDLDLLGVSHSQGFSAQRFRLTLSRPEGQPSVTCQIDGEQWQSGNLFEVEVIANAVPLLVPADFKPPWKG